MIDDKVKPLPVEGAGALVDIQPPPMLIEGLIPRGAVVLVAGPTYSGKTFFALELARAVATGDPFLGEFPVAHRGNVLIVEQDAPKYDTGQVMWSMLKRQWNEEGDAERASQGYSVIDPLYFSWHPGIDITKRLDVARIAATARSLRTDRGEFAERSFNPTYDPETGSLIDLGESVEFTEHAYKGAALIILDTLRALAVTAREDKSDDMEPIMQSLKLLRASTNATVLLIHHDNAAATRLRGSTAIDGATDHWFAISKNNKLGLSACRVKKARAVRPPSFRFQIETLDDPDLGLTKTVRFAGEIDSNTGVDDAPLSTGPNLRTQLLTWLQQQEVASGGAMLGAIIEWGKMQDASETTIRRYLKTFYEDGTATKENVQDGRAKKVRVHVKKDLTTT
jgi:RecA/RadA recombinase